MCLPSCGNVLNSKTETPITVTAWAKQFKVEQIARSPVEPPELARASAPYGTYLVTKWVSGGYNLHRSRHMPGFIYSAGPGKDKTGIHCFPPQNQDKWTAGADHKLWLAVSDVQTLPCSVNSGHVVAHTYQVLTCATCMEAVFQAQGQAIAETVRPMLEATVTAMVLEMREQLRQEYAAVLGDLQDKGTRWLLEIVLRSLGEMGVSGSLLMSTLLRGRQSEDTALPPTVALYQAPKG